MRKNIAIIGAGLSGLLLAHKLKDHAEVVVFEKARGVGGRMSTRYADPFYFDHGTQYFTARSDAFQAWLKPFVDDGVIAEWSGKVITLEVGKKPTKRIWFEPHFVAAPNMNSLCKKLAEGLDVRLSSEVAPIAKTPASMWVLKDKQGSTLGEYDWVVSTAPPAQTINLLHAALPDNTPLHQVRMQGCYALMIGFHTPWDKPWMAAKVDNNPLAWIAVNSSKPGRNKSVTSIVAHSRNNWADAHIDDDVGEAQQFLLEQFEAVTGIKTANADYTATHRWKYATHEESEHPGFYVDAEQNVAASSDWAAASRIEDVYLSASALAEQLLEAI